MVDGALGFQPQLLAEIWPTLVHLVATVALPIAEEVIDAHDEAVTPIGAIKDHLSSGLERAAMDPQGFWPRPVRVDGSRTETASAQ